MAGGYMGKILWVDLSNNRFWEEKLDEKICREYIGGYGIGARIAYSRQKAGVDALGPDNILGMMTGPLTGSGAPAGTRYTAFAKSPLTGGWGDANSGGDFGPYLKFAGFDGVLFTGAAAKPVYLLIDNGKAELRDASALWGKDACETEDALMDQFGKDARVACIGPGGENLSLIAAIMTDRGSAAGRSGLGAVMGSKKLKAVVARGTMAIPIVDKASVDRIRVEQIQAMRAPGRGGMSFLERWHKYGTSWLAPMSAHSGDTPVKNWGGVGVVDVPDVKGLDADALLTKVTKATACWHCPIGCKAIIKEGTGEYQYAAGSRRPEYETLGSFGVLCGQSNIEAINKANDLCNRAGLDTISAGTVIGFAIELYENGIITKKDTDGIDLKWGNHQAMIAMTEKMAKNEGLGAVLAKGVKVAAEKIGKGAEKFAVHTGGQEVGMHDPKLAGFGGWTSSARYQMDATPGRHTQAWGPSSFRGHVVNCLGLCTFGPGFGPPENNVRVMGNVNAVTGWGMSIEEITKVGERVMNLRHAFNLREGANELKWFVHPRITGNPPQTAGPLAGVTTDHRDQIMWSLGALDWDHATGKPSKDKLLSLGLDDVVKDLYPDPAPAPAR